MSNPIPLDDLRGKILAFYANEKRREKTTKKLNQALLELIATLGEDATTDGMTTEGISRWKARFCDDRSPATVTGLMSYLRGLLVRDR